MAALILALGNCERRMNDGEFRLVKHLSQVQTKDYLLHWHRVA